MLKSILTLVVVAGVSMVVSAQVQINKPIQLTGTGADARLTGIDNVSAAKDAVSAEVLQSGSLVHAASTGSGGAYAVALSPAVGSLTTGMVVNFTANHATTGAASIDVNGLGAVAIKKQVTDDLVADDIKSGQSVSLMYDGSNFQLLSQLGNASGGGGAADPTLVYTTNGF